MGLNKKQLRQLVEDLKDEINNLTTSKKPNFERMNSLVFGIEEACGLNEADGRTLAWTEERRAKHAEKVKKRLYYINTSDFSQGVFETLDAAAKALGIQQGSIRVRLSIKNNKADFRRAGSTWYLSTNKAVIDQIHKEAKGEESVNPALVLAEKAAARRAKKQQAA